MLLVHKREGQVAESCIIVCHPLQKTCNKQSHTLASTQGMRWCWKVWDKFNSLSSTKRLGISENSSIVPRSQWNWPILLEILVVWQFLLLTCGYCPIHS